MNESQPPPLPQKHPSKMMSKQNTDMKEWPLKKAYYAFIVVAMVLWIPLNLWFDRHDDALLHAVISDDLAAATRAVNEGANVHMTIKRNFTLLQIAAMNHDDVALARFLIEQGVSPAPSNDDGDTALSLARSKGHKELEAFLMDELKSTKNPEPQPSGRGYGSPAAGSPSPHH